MNQEKRSFKGTSDSPPVKKQKKIETLQELVHIRPDLKGKTVYFFPALDKYFEGVIMFDAKEKKAYIYSVKNDRKYDTFSKWITALKNLRLFKGHRSAFATIFLEPNPNSPSIASILGESNYSSYWKTSTYTSLEEIFSLIQKKIFLEGIFLGTIVQKITDGLEFHFFGREGQLEKKMIIIAKGVLLGYEVCVFDKILQEAHLPFPAKPMKRSLDEIKILTQYIFSLRICYGQNTNGFSDVVYIRGTQLINNAQTSNKEHVPFAFLEKQGQPGEAY
ncbi:unnamed protein product [Rhizophagus irregularis]|uniref:Uncharacterized protein n=1 Tax=Rhizophagus irregularis TaxID=588596 RepID=A0A916E1P2_9GLOM|nr:unnamed protein product [Rhizophagus irregularis]